MNKYIKTYISFWAILLVVFNVIAFVSTGWLGQEKYTPAFWCGYVAIMLSFAANLLCAWLAFRGRNNKQVFYNLAFFRINYAGLILSFVVGGGFMLTSVIQLWVCILVSVIAIGANTVAFIKAVAAAALVEETDNKLQTNTEFIKLLTADAKSLASTAKSEQNHVLTQKVLEAVRYSDPVSCTALSEIEQQLQQSFDSFAKCILENQDAAQAADQVLYLIEKRNQQCKALK